MKKLFILLGIAYVLASCAKDEMPLVQVEQTQEEQPLSYFMQEDDALAEAFNFFRHPMTKASAADIESIDFSGETVAYYVNFPEGGWALVSADKRTQTILAYNETGTYEESDLQGPAQFWFEDICSDLYALKKDTTILKDSPHLAKWQRRDAIKTPVTRGGDEHENEWLQLVYTYRDRVIECDISHLLLTHWGQGSPWNESAPYTSNSSITRCYTGCVTTALAQLLYYLHYEIDKPLFCFSQSSASGWYPDNFGINLSGYSSSVWDDMPLSRSDTSYLKPAQYVASFMAEIGWLLKDDSSGFPWFIFNNSNYGDSFGTSDREEISSFLSQKGINHSNWEIFDDDEVYESLINDMPVLISANNSNNHSKGHCWLIDGIKVIKTYDTYYSQWMPMWTYPPVEPEEPDWNHPENYVISEPILIDEDVYFRMNWGWDGQNDSTLYYYGDSWLMVNGYDFTYNRNIMYNFR